MVTENIEIRVRSNGAREAGREIANIGGQAQRANRSVAALGNIIQVAIGATVIRQAAQAADSFQQIQNRLGLITESESDLAGLTEAVFQQAQRTRTEFEAQASLVGRISRASRELGATQGQVLQVSEAVAQTFAISGASAQETTAASIQLGQALASGTLRGDELRSILENNARLSQTIADGLNVSVGELRELGAEGRITSREVFQAILADAERLNGEFSTLAPTIEQGFQVLENSIVRTIGALDITGSLGELLEDTADSINDILPIIVNVVGQARILTSSLFFGIEESFTQIELVLARIELATANTSSNIQSIFGTLDPEDVERATAAFEEVTRIQGELEALEGRREGFIRDQTVALAEQLSTIQQRNAAARQAAAVEESGDDAGEERNNNFIDFIRLQNDLATAQRAQAAQEEELERIAQERQDAESRGLAIVQSQQTEVERLIELLAEAQLLAGDGLLGDSEQAAETIGRIEESLESARQKAEETTDEISQFATQGARNIQSTLADFLFDPFDDGLQGMLSGFIDVLRRIAAEAAAAQILQSLFPSEAGGAAGLGSLIGGFFGGNAMGGTVRAGDVRLVGERGPELVSFPRNGQVTPNSQVGFAGGEGQGVTVLNTIDPESTLATTETARGREVMRNNVEFDREILQRQLGV